MGGGSQRIARGGCGLFTARTDAKAVPEFLQACEQLLAYGRKGVLCGFSHPL